VWSLSGGEGEGGAWNGDGRVVRRGGRALQVVVVVVLRRMRRAREVAWSWGVWKVGKSTAMKRFSSSLSAACVAEGAGQYKGPGVSVRHSSYRASK
jgi:hypothetical protein